jgi:membrane-bound lytic murein transglycosylase F
MNPLPYLPAISTENSAKVSEWGRVNTESFSDVKNVEERKRFVLASYNGGSGHIRDAMALTTKQGGNPQRWADVAERLLLLREPEYYNDPVVKHGYIRSTETHDYVELILERYKQYRRSAPLRR